MKFHWVSILFIILSACSQQNSEENEELTYNTVNSNGVLLGNEIQLLDESLTLIKDISSYNESFVQILAVSDSIFQENEDYCNDYQYVKIKAKDFEGIVNGKFVFEPIKSIQNRSNEKFKLTITSYFATGAFDEFEDITGCVEIAPLLLIDNDSQSLIHMIKNEYYKEDYPYFRLNSDSEIWDEIVEVKKVNNQYQLKIDTKWQDGGESFLVEISYKNDKYMAEILNKKPLN